MVNFRLKIAPRNHERDKYCNGKGYGAVRYAMVYKFVSLYRIRVIINLKVKVKAMWKAVSKRPLSVTDQSLLETVVHIQKLLADFSSKNKFLFSLQASFHYQIELLIDINETNRIALNSKVYRQRFDLKCFMNSPHFLSQF